MGRGDGRAERRCEVKDYHEDFPWGEFLKECIPFAVVLVVYFAIQYAISAENIAWYLTEVAK